MRFRLLLVAAGLVAAPLVLLAQNGDLTHQQSATPDANVDFGVLPTAPRGPLPCLQSGAIGGPNDPCSFKLHHLTPEEVTIEKGGQLTFQVHGGGHAMAIYEVSKNTTRDDIGPLLCGTNDPTRMTDPAQHADCNLSPQANDSHFISDGKVTSSSTSRQTSPTCIPTTVRGTSRAG